MKKMLSAIVAAGVIILMIAGCNKLPEENASTSTHGRLVVRITDDPFNIEWVESATVTITRIDARREGISGDSAFITLANEPVTINLVDLRNGTVGELANLDVPKGNYDLVRLYVDQAELRLKDKNQPFTVKVPSGSQTGIKIFIDPSLTVDGGLTSELLLDMDLSGSFVMRGNLAHSAGVNGFIFKPVIRAVNMTFAGRVEGFVTDTAKVKIKNAKVWLAKDTVIATAFTDTLGHYALIGIPSGIYSAFAARENYDTVKHEGVKVEKGNRTVVDFVLLNN